MKTFLFNQIYQLKGQVKPTVFFPSFYFEFALTVVQLFHTNFIVLAHTVLEKI